MRFCFGCYIYYYFHISVGLRPAKQRAQDDPILTQNATPEQIKARNEKMLPEPVRGSGVGVCVSQATIVLDVVARIVASNIKNLIFLFDPKRQ